MEPGSESSFETREVNTVRNVYPGSALILIGFLKNRGQPVADPPESRSSYISLNTFQTQVKVRSIGPVLKTLISYFR